MEAESASDAAAASEATFTTEAASTCAAVETKQKALRRLTCRSSGGVGQLAAVAADDCVLFLPWPLQWRSRFLCCSGCRYLLFAHISRYVVTSMSYLHQLYLGSTMYSACELNESRSRAEGAVPLCIYSTRYSSGLELVILCCSGCRIGSYLVSFGMLAHPLLFFTGCTWALQCVSLHIPGLD